MWQCDVRKKLKTGFHFVVQIPIHSVECPHQVPSAKYTDTFFKKDLFLLFANHSNCSVN